MACLYLIAVTCLSFVRLIHSSTDTCDQLMSVQKKLSMLNGTYPACRDIDITLKLPICEVDKDDVSDTCSTSTHTIPCLKSACPDGSWSRTCYPVPTDDVIYAFSCVCHSAVHVWNVADVRVPYWSNWEPLDHAIDGAYFARRLMVEGGGCITQEFIKMRLIVYDYNLPNSVYTASSSYSSYFSAERARVNTPSSHCAWVALYEDTEKWLGITLPGDYITGGALVSKKCSPLLEHPGVVTVTTSYDDITWLNVSDRVDVTSLYDDDHNAYIWFATRYTSRFWRIQIIEIAGTGANPRMVSDLIGTAV